MLHLSESIRPGRPPGRRRQETEVRKIRPVLATLALLGATTATGMTAGAAPAMATAAECTGGAHGFEDIADSYAYGTSHGSVNLDSTATVTLMSAHIGLLSTRGYARLSGRYVTGARVWMDWTRDGGTHWLQCGPFGPSGGGPLTTPAQLTNPSTKWRFRACGDIPGAVAYKCTAWW
jgi:hypothetical protein